ncbi:hypothetical protein HDV01_000588 [Terramyces sp. JEL0728]|nr:hypothetical protein HDV01_000588 [Terramyces sp. JEL0728]
MVLVDGKSIPPFVGTNPQQELSYSGLKIVDEDVARDLMTSTIGKSNKQQVYSWSSDRSDSESEDKKDDTETDVEEKKDFQWNPPPIENIDNAWINHKWDLPVFDSLSNNADLDNLFSEFDL